jgi:hypothetical protein
MRAWVNSYVVVPVDTDAGRERRPDGVLPDRVDRRPGESFGSGSARQSAVEVLPLSVIQAVLAESMARVHWRNSIALALPTYVGISELVHDQDEIQIDTAANVVRNLTCGGELPRRWFRKG